MPPLVVDPSAFPVTIFRGVCDTLRVGSRISDLEPSLEQYVTLSKKDKSAHGRLAVEVGRTLVTLTKK